MPWTVRKLTKSQYDILLLHMQIDLDEIENAKNGVKDPSKIMKKDPLFEKRLKEAQQRNLEKKKNAEAVVVNSDLEETLKKKQQEIAERLAKAKT